jgi:hypothetical protein
MFTMPTITRLACYAILVACMLTAILLGLGDLTGALAITIASMIMFAGIIALNL